MNLGFDDLRDLLERFLSNTGGRRGRSREQARREQERPADASQGLDQDDVTGAGAGIDAASASGESDTTQGQDASTATRQERPDADDLDDEDLVDDLYYRIESLEEELEDNGSQLGAIQDSQEHVAGQVEDVNDTIRQLLGIYDQVTNDVNPFTGDGEAENGFGVFGASDEDDDGTGFGLHADESGPGDGGEETVSFADLKDAIEDAAAAASNEDGDDAPAGQKITFDEEAYIGGDREDDTHVEVQATEHVDAEDEHEREHEADSEDDGVTLHTLANTYATDLLVFEWLTELIQTAGPAATLRAISYYDEIGWIDADVKEHLEGVLGGPDLDIHVDPTTAPQELTAEDHADSYTYIMKLSEVHRTRREVES